MILKKKSGVSSRSIFLVLFFIFGMGACQFEKRPEISEPNSPPVIESTPHTEPEVPPASLGFEHGNPTPTNDETQPTTQPTPETTPSTQPTEGASGF